MCIIYIYTYLHICMSTYDVVLGPPTPIVSTTPSATAKFVDMFNTGPIYIYILSLSLQICFMHISRSEHDLSKCVVIMFYFLAHTHANLDSETSPTSNQDFLSGGHWNREGSDDHHPLLHCHSEDRGWCLCQGHRACQQCIWLPQSTK